MKVRIEAKPGELSGKAHALFERLGKALAEEAPDAAEALEKAAHDLPRATPELKHRALRDGLASLQKRYAKTLEQIVLEIGQALDQHVDELKKSASPDYSAGIIRIEDAAYEKMKLAFTDLGYAAADFDEGGKLFGLSLTELRELHKTLASKTG